MKKIFYTVMLGLSAIISLKAQTLTKREVYQSMEIGQRQLIHKTISSYWNYTLNADTMEVHQFLGWLDTISTPGVWVGEWAVFPCRKILRSIDQGNGTQISDVLYFIAGDATNETHTITHIDSAITPTYYALSDLTDAVLLDSTSEFLIGDPTSCLDSLSKVTKQINFFGISTTGNSRFTSSEMKRGVGEVMYSDSIPNSNVQWAALHEYIEKREQVLFENSNGQCADESIVLKESMADEGLTLYDINNFSVGDEFIYALSDGSHDMMGGWNSTSSYSYIKITAKQETATDFIYTYDKHDWSDNGNQWYMNLEMALSKVGHIDPTLSSVTYLPGGMQVFYDSLCHMPTWHWYWDETISDVWYQRSEGYGKGLGHINSYTYQMNYSHSMQLVDFRKNGMACGDWMEMSVEKEGGQSAWGIFPTLVSNEVYLVGPTDVGNVQYQIHDQWGRMLESAYFPDVSGYQPHTLHLLNFVPGVYFISLLKDREVLTTQRLVKL